MWPLIQWNSWTLFSWSFCRLPASFSLKKCCYRPNGDLRSFIHFLLYFGFTLACHALRCKGDRFVRIIHITALLAAIRATLVMLTCWFQYKTEWGRSGPFHCGSQLSNCVQAARRGAAGLTVKLWITPHLIKVCHDPPVPSSVRSKRVTSTYAHHPPGMVEMFCLRNLIC